MYNKEGKTKIRGSGGGGFVKTETDGEDWLLGMCT
jgi:hypothetical protein